MNGHIAMATDLLMAGHVFKVALCVISVNSCKQCEARLKVFLYMVWFISRTFWTSKSGNMSVIISTSHCSDHLLSLTHHLTNLQLIQCIRSTCSCASVNWNVWLYTTLHIYIAHFVDTLHPLSFLFCFNFLRNCLSLFCCCFKWFKSNKHCWKRLK